MFETKGYRLPPTLWKTVANILWPSEATAIGESTPTGLESQSACPQLQKGPVPPVSQASLQNPGEDPTRQVQTS